MAIHKDALIEVGKQNTIVKKLHNYMFWVILIIIVIGAIIAVVVDSNAEKERKENITQALTTMSDFTPTSKFVGPKSTFVFAFDNSRQCAFYMNGPIKKFINYEDIISVELVEDNGVIMKKSTGRTLGGALVGGVLAGGVGAIVGGLSGSSKQNTTHSSVNVRVLLRNSGEPSITIPCYDCRTMEADGKPVVMKNDSSLSGIYYKEGLAIARRITDTITVIIDAVDKASKSESTVAPSTNTGSVADELAKLAILKEKGILTSEEFAEQKAKLLNQTSAPSPEKPKLQLPSTDAFDENIRNMVISGKKIDAIKYVMDTLGMSLSAAIDYVENL